MFVFLVHSSQVTQRFEDNLFLSSDANNTTGVLMTSLFYLNAGVRGSTVVKVLCYKSEGRWFDSRWCNWNFSLHFDRTMALGSTQPLTEMSTRSISWG